MEEEQHTYSDFEPDFKQASEYLKNFIKDVNMISVQWKIIEQDADGFHHYFTTEKLVKSIKKLLNEV